MSREGVFRKAEPRVLGTMAPLLAVAEFGISSLDDRSLGRANLILVPVPRKSSFAFFFLKEFFLNYVDVGAGSVHMSAGTQSNQKCRLPWEMTTVGARKQTLGQLQEQYVLLTAEQSLQLCLLLLCLYRGPLLPVPSWILPFPCYFCLVPSQQPQRFPFTKRTCPEEEGRADARNLSALLLCRGRALLEPHASHPGKPEKQAREDRLRGGVSREPHATPGRRVRGVHRDRHRCPSVPLLSIPHGEEGSGQ